MQDQDVIVKVTGMGELTDGEKVTTTSKGKLYTKAGARYLVYYVVDENNPKDLIRHILKMSDTSVSVSKTHPRHANLSTKFTLLAGQKTDSEYNTPFGCLNLTFNTLMLGFKEDEEKLIIDAKYNIMMDKDVLSKNRLEILVTPDR